MKYEPQDFQAFPDNLEQRWEFMKYFIGCWFEPIRQNDGCGPADLDDLFGPLAGKVPQILELWARHSGTREDIWKSLGEARIPLTRCRVECDFVLFRSGSSEYAFRLGDEEDPELFDWRGPNREPSSWDCRLSDYLIVRMLAAVWWGAGEQPIPYFSKGVQIPEDRLTFSNPNSNLPDQRLELEACLTAGPRHHFWYKELHSTDLLCSHCYPNTVLVAARSDQALAVLPIWLQRLLKEERNTLESYECYRNIG